MMNLRCERAGVNDGAALFDLCKPYFEEAFVSKCLELCETTAIATFCLACAHSSYDCLVVKGNSQFAGVIITCYNTSFFKGFEGNIDFFYVAPAYRGTNAGRLLVAKATEEAKHRGATMLYCGCHSGFSDGGRNNQLYVNLYKKHGFEVNGSNMQKYLGE